MFLAQNEEKCEKIATALLIDKLVACCNIIPQINSMYWWNGKICKDSEYMIIIKTIQSNCEKIINNVKINHDYETPEVNCFVIILKFNKDYF